MDKKTVYVVIENGMATRVFRPVGVDVDVRIIDLDTTVPEEREEKGKELREVEEDPDYEEDG